MLPVACSSDSIAAPGTPVREETDKLGYSLLKILSTRIWRYGYDSMSVSPEL